MRREYREALDAELAAPLDPDERARQKQEEWGLSQEAIEHAEQTDAVLGEATYEIPEG